MSQPIQKMPNTKKSTDSVYDIIVTALNTEPVRADKYLSTLKRKDLYSRNFIDKLFNLHRVFINKKIAKKSTRLYGGETIAIKMPIPEIFSIEPQNIPINIVFEDEHLAVIDKPAGMVVHPAPGHYNDTLVNALEYHFTHLSRMSAPIRPGIVHRLDKDTSGLLIIAKNDYTHYLLKELFMKREIKKIYLALTMGRIDDRQGTIETHICRHPTDRQRMCVCNDLKGKYALTHYKVLRHYLGFDLVRIRLETGRTHQIRVHFAHMSHPVLADYTYSTKRQMLNMSPLSVKTTMSQSLEKIIRRQALHAHRLEFLHPITNERIIVQSPLPDDIHKMILHFKQLEHPFDV